MVPSEPNPYASPAAAPTPARHAPKCILWFVGATLAGMFLGCVFKDSFRIYLAISLHLPFRTAKHYLLAAVVATLVSLLQYNRSSPLKTRTLEIIPRVVGGLALGFVPYHFLFRIAQLVPAFLMIPPAVAVVVNIAIGILVSLALENLTRKLLRRLPELG